MKKFTASILRQFVVLLATVFPLSACATLDSSSRIGFPNRCPEVAESFKTMNEATYQVFAQFDGFDSAGQPLSQFAFIGTSWGVGNRLLATNAHVAEAYQQIADQGAQVTRAVAVQSGTGKVIRLLRGLLHPDYNGNPLGSPDVALFTSQEELPAILPLADPDAVLLLGDEFQLVGFPGDVNDWITVTPGETVPQATSLTGSISALRSHDLTVQVDSQTLDYYQHQAPTTPGTSGSAMVYCGLVVAINNAGTVQFVVIPTPEGELAVDRTAAASNNFAVHVKHIHEIVNLFQAQAVQGFELPVKATSVIALPAEGGNGGGVEQPAYIGGYAYGEVFGQTAEIDLSHQLEFYIDASTWKITGTSYWGDGLDFKLTGQYTDSADYFEFYDNAPEVNSDFRVGKYYGNFYADFSFSGWYFEEGLDVYVPIGGTWELVQ